MLGYIFSVLQRFKKNRSINARGGQPHNTTFHGNDLNTLIAQRSHFGRVVGGLRDYAIFLLDQNGHVVTWNLGAEQIKGYRAEEIIGQHFSRFYTPDALSSGWPLHELEVAKVTGRFEDEGWRVRKDGSRFWANVVITTLRDDRGSVSGFVKVTRDMTDRKHAEEKLRLSEERFRLLVDGVRDYAIFMLTPEGSVATWNTGAGFTTGYGAEEVIGKHFSLFYPNEANQRDCPQTELCIAKETGRFEEEGWRVKKDGAQFWANIVITALRNEAGALQGFAKVIRDMSERRKSEDDRRRLVEEEIARQAAESAAQEAQQAREEERRQREQLLVTLNSIGDAVIVTDSNGRVTFLNPVAVELTGWRLDDAEMQPLERVFNIINEDSRRTVENPVETVFREQRIVELANHTAIVRRDGSEVPIEDSAAPIRGTNGDIIGAVLVFRDVTAARRALQDHVRLSAIVTSSQDAIIGNDLHGTITSWNRGAELLYGYTADEIIGKPLSVLIPSDHPDDLSHTMEKIKVGERIEHFETVRLRKDGSRIEVSLSVSPITDDENRVVGASKIARDVSKSKRQEVLLRFVAKVSKILGEIHSITNTMSRVVEHAVPSVADWCNIHILDSTGAIQHAHPIAAMSPALNDSMHTWITNVIATGDPLQLLRVENVADTEFATSLANAGIQSLICCPLKIKSQIYGAISFTQTQAGRYFDVADVHMATDVAQRISIAIENSMLYHKVRDADRRKDEFLAMLSHELRNPLAPIRSGLEILAMDPGPHQEPLQVMQEQVEHVVRLVDDLLDVSRIVQGKIELRKSKCELIELVKRSIDAVRSQFLSREQSFEFIIPEQSVWIDADPIRIVQVVENLLNNAAKYTDPGGRIQLQLEVDGGFATVRVSDNGVGMDADLLPQVFELFTQSKRSLDRSQGGLGIGLTLVQRLVEMHGGTVLAQSDGLGQGSCFTVRLPVSAPSANMISPLPMPVRSVSYRIAIVDDNRSAAYMLQMLLKKLGDHEIMSSCDGPSFLQSIQELAQSPQIVFLDIGLPGMSGYEVAKQIRQTPSLQNVLLIALTGYGQDEDRKKSMLAGFDLHLVKPPAISQILDALNHPKLTSQQVIH